MSRFKILIAEDYDIMRRALEYKLGKENFSVTSVMDGRLAMKMLNEQDFDLIISDIMMPFFSGLELVNHVRNKLGKKTPIIMLTSINMKETLSEALNLGANDFINKPFNPEELIVRVKKILGLN